MKQITDAVKLTMKSDVTSLEMQLYPEHLGKISIQVAAKNGVMTAQIAAENETAKIAVESQIDILKQSLQEQGLKVESIEVMVSTKGFDQEKGNNHSQESEKNKNRRVRKDILEELTKDQEDEEDESVKETLGNTVSFTA
jgi:flagellar hook-length control protein FliK